MHALYRVVRRQRRDAALKRFKIRRLQGAINRFIPTGVLHMAGRNFMAPKYRMGKKDGGH